MEEKKRKIFKVKYTNYFEPKKYLLTYTEIKFYNNLFEIAERLNLVLYTRVSIYELVNIKDTLYKRIAFRQCGHYTVDFVLATKDTSEIKLCIQLIDPYTDNVKTLKRQKFVDDLFDELNIKLLKIKITDEFNKDYMEIDINNIIGNQFIK